MSELRQDPITRDWVIVSPERAARPRDIVGGGVCPFCPGNEAMSGPDIDRLADEHGAGSVRAIANRFPALADEAGVRLDLATDRNGWRRLPGFGRHEVIIETPEHATSLGQMPVAQARRALRMYVHRYRALAATDAGLRQVVLFRNHGERAGTSLVHPHAQIVATPAVAPETRRRVMDEIAWFDENGRCGMCHVTAREGALRERIVLESASFVSFVPFAARAAYQLQIVPRRHAPDFAEVDDGELDDLAVHLTRVLGALGRCLDDPAYNLVVVTPPLDLVHRAASHWFIDIVPRLATPAGFELGARIVISAHTPEAAAQALRASLDETA